MLGLLVFACSAPNSTDVSVMTKSLGATASRGNSEIIGLITLEVGGAGCRYVHA